MKKGGNEKNDNDIQRCLLCRKQKIKKSFQRIAIPKTMTRDIQKLFHEKWMKSLSVANSATEKNAVKIKKKTLQKNEHHLSLPSNNKIH